MGNVPIKSMLTNTIKEKFPNIDHNEKYYRGLMFRADIVETPSVKLEEKNTEELNPLSNEQTADDNY